MTDKEKLKDRGNKTVLKKRRNKGSRRDRRNRIDKRRWRGKKRMSFERKRQIGEEKVINKERQTNKRRKMERNMPIGTNVKETGKTGRRMRNMILYLRGEDIPLMPQRRKGTMLLKEDEKLLIAHRIVNIPLTCQQTGSILQNLNMNVHLSMIGGKKNFMLNARETRLKLLKESTATAMVTATVMDITVMVMVIVTLMVTAIHWRGENLETQPTANPGIMIQKDDMLILKRKQREEKLLIGKMTIDIMSLKLMWIKERMLWRCMLTNSQKGGVTPLIPKWRRGRMLIWTLLIGLRRCAMSTLCKKL